MVTVAAAEFQKNFGRYREKALVEPVTVTSYGRDSVVVLSVEEYQRLKSQDREALYAWELSEAELREIAATEPHPGAALFDHELKP